MRGVENTREEDEEEEVEEINKIEIRSFVVGGPSRGSLPKAKAEKAKKNSRGSQRCREKNEKNVVCAMFISEWRSWWRRKNGKFQFTQYKNKRIRFALRASWRILN